MILIVEITAGTPKVLESPMPGLVLILQVLVNIVQTPKAPESPIQGPPSTFLMLRRIARASKEPGSLTLSLLAPHDRSKRTSQRPFYFEILEFLQEGLSQWII